MNKLSDFYALTWLIISRFLGVLKINQMVAFN